MARQTLTKTAAVGPYSQTTATAVTFTACDVGNSDEFVMTGGELLLIWNTHAVTTYTYTLTSVDDATGRSADITTQNITAGQVLMFGPVKAAGWQQTNGKFYLAASNASVKFAVITL